MMTTRRNDAPAFDHTFDDFLRSALRDGTGRSSFPVAVDVREKNDEYTFQFDVPGVAQEDIEITMTDGVLSVRGSRCFEVAAAEKVTRGRPYGEFAVSYALPDGIDEDGLTADLAEGVLSIRVPKKPQAQARKIPIGSGADRAHSE